MTYYLNLTISNHPIIIIPENTIYLIFVVRPSNKLISDLETGTIDWRLEKSLTRHSIESERFLNRAVERCG